MRSHSRRSDPISRPFRDAYPLRNVVLGSACRPPRHRLQCRSSRNGPPPPPRRPGSGKTSPPWQVARHAVSPRRPLLDPEPVARRTGRGGAGRADPHAPAVRPQRPGCSAAPSRHQQYRRAPPRSHPRGCLPGRAARHRPHQPRGRRHAGRRRHGHSPRHGRRTPGPGGRHGAQLRHSSAGHLRARRHPHPDAGRVQRRRLPRQGAGPERLRPVAAQLRPRLRLPCHRQRGPRAARLPRQPGRQLAAAKGLGPGLPRRRQAARPRLGRLRHPAPLARRRPAAHAPGRSRGGAHHRGPARLRAGRRRRTAAARHGPLQRRLRPGRDPPGDFSVERECHCRRGCRRAGQGPAAAGRGGGDGPLSGEVRGLRSQHSPGRRGARRGVRPAAAAQLHRRPRLGQAPPPGHHALAAGRRCHLPAPRHPGCPRPAADARRSARLPRRHGARPAGAAGGPPAGAARIRRLLGEQVGRPAAAQPVSRRHQGGLQPRRLAARRLPPQ